MKRRVVAFALMAAASAGCASMSMRTPTVSVEPELKLAPGPFPALAGTALGDPVTFENDIYSAKCFPLFAVSGRSQTVSGTHATGTVLLWINRGHFASGRVFVAPCEIAAPFEASSTQIGGAVSDSWFEVTPIREPGISRISLRRLNVPGWEEFSSPEFCGRSVAFWSLETGGAISANVIDLLDPKHRSSSSLGMIEIAGSDMGWGVPPAAWSPDCAAATFSTGQGVTRTVHAPR